MADRDRRRQRKAREQHQRGRPSSYDPSQLVDVTNLAMLGYTEPQIAEQLGVSVTTIESWKRKHADFARALNEGKDIADGKVVRSLYERAVGYSHPEEKIFFNKDTGVVVHDTIKHYPPDPVAAIFWLKNRQRARWRDVRQSELSGPDGAPMALEVIPVKQLDPADRAKLRRFLEAQVTDVEDLSEEPQEDDDDESDDAAEDQT